MAGEAIDRATRYADAGQDGVDRRTDMLCREGRDGSVEDDAEPARIDLPAHDVETVGPQMLTGALDARQTTLSRAHDAGRRAIAKHHPDAIVTPMLVPHGTDSVKLRTKGITAYGLTPMVLDLATAGSMHSDTEHIPVAEFLSGLHIFYDLLSSDY